jgi:hypothetical protein
MEWCRKRDKNNQMSTIAKSRQGETVRRPLPLTGILY